MTAGQNPFSWPAFYWTVTFAANPAFLSDMKCPTPFRDMGFRPEGHV